MSDQPQRIPVEIRFLGPNAALNRRDAVVIARFADSNEWVEWPVMQQVRREAMTETTCYIDPIHDKAAHAIAEVLTNSGMLEAGPALNCAQACLTALAVNGLTVTAGKMELWYK
jgi:hypothetical protein